jgi:hypothetical protein
MSMKKASDLEVLCELNLVGRGALFLLIGGHLIPSPALEMRRGANTTVSSNLTAFVKSHLKLYFTFSIASRFTSSDAPSLYRP